MNAPPSRLLLRALLGACLSLSACVSSPQPILSVPLPSLEPLTLKAEATLESRAIDESSGIVASRRFAGLYWTHNDSGGKPEVYAFDRSGRSIGSPVRVIGATNVDWEDIAADDAGNLWIADTGNNLNARTDLCLYVLPEPDPRATNSVRASRKINIRYPDQILFPPPRLEYDCEALFIAWGKPYLLTKHRGSSTTKLYRLDARDDGLSAPLTLLATLDIGGMVTAADASADGRRLLVLTYTAVWLFEAKQGDAYFEGSIRWLPIRAGQCEAICFDRDDSIVITNEQARIYRLRVDDLIVVRE
jgi:hypothetical protein